MSLAPVSYGDINYFDALNPFSSTSIWHANEKTDSAATTDSSIWTGLRNAFQGIPGIITWADPLSDAQQQQMWNEQQAAMIKAGADSNALAKAQNELFGFMNQNGKPDIALPTLPSGADLSKYAGFAAIGFGLVIVLLLLVAVKR